jgi:ribose transport system substrate-binding protein
VPLSAGPSIGFISLDASLPYAQAVSAGIRDSAADAGLDVVECDADWTRDGALGCAAELASAGVHGLISFQPFPELTDDICDALDGRPAVGVVFPQGSCQVSLLTIDQAASGRLAGDAVGALAAERWACDVNAFISLESNDTDPDGRARMQGYRDGYTEHCALPEKTVALDGAEHLLTAQTQMTQLLRELTGKPNVVVGLNEDAILGAMAAVDSAGRTGQFWYSGQLADPAIRTEIACNERYVASVAQFPERFGALIVPTLAAAMDGEEVDPELVADLQMVTSDNVRELFPDTPACDA